MPYNKHLVNRVKLICMGESCVWSVLTTSVKILPYRPRARLRHITIQPFNKNNRQQYGSRGDKPHKPSCSSCSYSPEPCTEVYFLLSPKKRKLVLVRSSSAETISLGTILLLVLPFTFPSLTVFTIFSLDQ